MAAVESHGVAEWIYSTLGSAQGLVNLSIYEDIAPQRATKPYVIFSMQTSEDVNALGPNRAASEQTWLVKVVAQGGTYKAVADYAGSVDAALSGKIGTATAGSVAVRCTRDREVRYTETVDGMVWKHLGAVYRIFAGGV